MAEKGELVAEAISVGIENISCEIPPLGLEITVEHDDLAEIRTASLAPPFSNLLHSQAARAKPLAL